MNVSAANNSTGISATPDEYPIDYAGVWGLWGASLYPCRGYYNDYFNATSEYDKAGSAAASTILALLPALLAFGPLRTAKIGLLIQLSGSSSVGFMAAASTFGFQIQQLSTLPQEAFVSVKDFFKNDPWAIDVYGSAGNHPTTEAQPRAPEDEHRNAEVVAVHATGGRARPGHCMISRELGERLRALQTKVNSPTRLRPKRWVVCAIDILAWGIQAIWVIIISLVTVYVIDDIAFIWVCPGLGTAVFSGWLVASLVGVGIIRGIYESKSYKASSVFHLSYIPTNVKPIRCPMVAVELDLWAGLDAAAG